MSTSLEYVDIYRRMALIKECDQQLRSAIISGQFAAPYYSPRGQEAIPSAISVNLTNDDYICTIYRGIHDMLAKGISVKELWAEIAGRKSGTCKGKGGPMHVTDPKTGVMVTTGVVGSSMPLANGLAVAAQLRGEDRVAVAYFGDGAANIGAFHESLNMASLWKLPVIFVCQNNNYAEHTRFDLATTVENIADRAASYSMPGVTVNGNDVLEVYEAGKEAIARARRGEGPTLLEAKTFRFHGHYLGDTDGYMREGEKKEAEKNDPIPAYRAWLVQNQHATEEEIEAIHENVAREVQEAAEFALTSPFPDIAELRRDVFVHEVSA